VGSWPSLREAARAFLQEWRAQFPKSRYAFRVALQGTLVESRQVTLPPLTDDDARRLLVRNAARHFLSAAEPLSVSVAPSFEGVDPAQSVRIACAMPTRVLQAILEALGPEEGMVGWIGPAWAVHRLLPQREAGDVMRTLDLDVTATLITWQAGQPRALRRFARNAEGVDALAEVLRAEPGVATILGNHADEQALVQELGERGVFATASAIGGASVTRDMKVVRFVTPSVPEYTLALGLTLVSPGAATRTSFGAARRGLVAILALLALCVAATLLYQRSIAHALADVRAARQTLRDSLPLADSPDDIEARERWLRAVQTAPRWAEVLAAVGTHLEAPAFLERVQVRADTIVLEGRTPDLAASFAALDTVPLLRNVRSVGSVRRNAGDAREGDLRFVLEAQWRPH
jgi:hypothetical protein